MKNNISMSNWRVGEQGSNEGEDKKKQKGQNVRANAFVRERGEREKGERRREEREKEREGSYTPQKLTPRIFFLHFSQSGARYFP